MRLIYHLFTVVFLCMLVMSCKNDKTGIVPADIEDLTYSPGAGRVVLHWKNPQDSSSINYIRFTYYDSLTQKHILLTSSIYSDSLVISNMRKKFGEYSIDVQTVSSTGGTGQLQNIKVRCNAAPATITAEPYSLTVGMLSTNAQEPAEGPLANLVDGNTSSSNYFHTAWSIDITDYPYFQIHIPDELSNYIEWNFVSRNSKCIPNNIYFYGSEDGTDWFLIRHYTTDDGFPVDASSGIGGKTYSSGVTSMPDEHNSACFFRFVVKGNNTGDTDASGKFPCFNMSEFRLFKVIIDDPEKK